MIIIKIGGGKDINLPGIIKGLSEMKEKFLIVHGANQLRDALLARLGMQKKMLTSASGYTSVYSDDEAIDVLMMAYSGVRNKRLVELCQRNGINAVGLSGLDGKAVTGKRNQGIRVREGGKLKIVRDNSGKPASVNTALINLLLDHGYAPVLCVPIIDENNFAINSENDDIVNLLQKELKADKIIQFIEAAGFLENRNDSESLVREIPKADLLRREEQVEGRMKRKMLALRKLFEYGAAEVIISDGRTEDPVKDALEGKGTIIK
jgi:acetylglutamate/LysW-gamma-L-alpha-aminoadipate kinase